MEVLRVVLEVGDRILCAPYLLPLPPLLAWLTGTFCLALIASLFGEITLAILYWVNRHHIKKLATDMTRRHNQSVNALISKDKGAFKAINRLANDAFGKVFFVQIAMGMASLWPAFFAAAWLKMHFADVAIFNLHFIDWDVYYLPPFVPLYIVARILFTHIKHRIPLFKKLAKTAEKMAPEEEMQPLF
jgi:hypothetical protein